MGFVCNSLISNDCQYCANCICESLVQHFPLGLCRCLFLSSWKLVGLIGHPSCLNPEQARLVLTDPLSILDMKVTSDDLSSWYC